MDISQSATDSNSVCTPASSGLPKMQLSTPSLPAIAPRQVSELTVPPRPTDSVAEESVRFFGVLSALAQNDTLLPMALRICAAGALYPEHRSCIGSISQMIESGRTLTAALRATRAYDLFPAFELELLRTTDKNVSIDKIGTALRTLSAGIEYIDNTNHQFIIPDDRRVFFLKLSCGLSVGVPEPVLFGAAASGASIQTQDLAEKMYALWQVKPSFTEIFSELSDILTPGIASALKEASSSGKLESMLSDFAINPVFRVFKHLHK